MFPSANHSFSSSDSSNLQHGRLGGGPGQNQPPHQSSDGSMPYGEGYDAPQQPSDGAMGYGGQGSYEDCPKGEYGASMSQNENGQPQEPPKGPPWYRQGPGSQAIPQDQWNNLDSGGQAGTMGHDTGAQSYDQQGDIPPPPWYQQGPGSQAIPQDQWNNLDSGAQAGTMGHDTGAQSYDQQGDIPPPPWYQQGPGSQAIPQDQWNNLDSGAQA